MTSCGVSSHLSLSEKECGHKSPNLDPEWVFAIGYKQLMRLTHPDKHPSDLREKATLLTQLLSAIFDERQSWAAWISCRNCALKKWKWDFSEVVKDYLSSGKCGACPDCCRSRKKSAGEKKTRRGRRGKKGLGSLRGSKYIRPGFSGDLYWKNDLPTCPLPVLFRDQFLINGEINLHSIDVPDRFLIPQVFHYQGKKNFHFVVKDGKDCVWNPFHPDSGDLWEVVFPEVPSSWQNGRRSYYRKYDAGKVEALRNFLINARLALGRRDR